MIGRIVRPADFQRVLAAPQRSRSPHFALHHLAQAPGVSAKAAKATLETLPAVEVAQGFSTELSTDLLLLSPEGSVHVDKAVPTGASQAVDNSVLRGHWLGLVVPKRHARRAVTRNLIKRQVRAMMAEVAHTLPAGLWVVRLRAPFDRQVFHSPASEPLRDCTRSELVTLFDRAVRSPLPPRPARPPGAGQRGASR